MVFREGKLEGGSEFARLLDVAGEEGALGGGGFDLC